ncbi:MAG: nucleotidyltransferase family protein [Aquificaceae bacterium]|uniref:nucleotidyltransferase family protein n=1 Tax=Hydrogenobacter sp. Uz 6-8 TaxID=3384828 RepID=UPI00309BC341
MGKKEIERLRGQVLQTLGERLNMEKCLLLLYGSTALGEDTELSDIDLALDCLEPLDDRLFLEIVEELSLRVDTPRKIELVEIRRLSEEFLESIIKGAVLWHVGRDYLKSWFRQRRL